MRLRRKTIIGKIDSKGSLSAPWGVLEDFCKMHKDRGVIIRAEILSQEPSERVTNYYFGYIVEEMRDAIMQTYGERLSKAQTDQWIREKCPLFYKEERKDGEWRMTLKEWEELDSAEANEVFEWVFQYASENLNLILDDAR